MRKTLIAFLVASCSLCFGDTLVLKNGSRHEGTLQTATSRTVTFKEGTKIHRYLRSDIEFIEFGESTSASTSPEAGTSSSTGTSTFGSDSTTSSNATTSSRTSLGSSSGTASRRAAIGQSATLPAGTELLVMTNENIDSATANEGQTFSADVAENVTNSAGKVVIPKGSEAELVLRKVQQAGTVTGTPELALDLQSVKVNGRRYTVSTQDVEQAAKNEGIGKNKRTATMVGGGAVLGTLIGAIAGGGKGAAIGAVTGAAAGAGAQVLTRGKTVKVPAESKLRFKLDQDLELRASY